MHKTTHSEKNEQQKQDQETVQNAQNSQKEQLETQQVLQSGGEASHKQTEGQTGQTAERFCKEEIELIKEKNELIESLQKELAEAKDQYLRKLADYENFRKRMFRERDDAVAYANTQLLNDLVDVLDNFDRAIQSADVSKDFTALHDGIVMIQKHFISLLEGKYGLKRYDSLNTEFDPNRHEAMCSEIGACEYPLVIEEYSKGYMLKDRVLRTARVKVRMPSAGNQSASASRDTAGTAQEQNVGTTTDTDAADAGQSRE